MDRKYGPRVEEKIDDLESKLGRIEDKIDVMQSSVVSMDKILDRNTASLEIHEKRTTASEKRIEYIEKHVYVLNAMVKIAAGVAGFSGCVLAILQIISFFKS